jgi:uncharacterized protein
MAENHPVVWFEVVGKEGQKTRRFYGELFGWKLDAENPMRYAMVEANGKGIPGGVGEVEAFAKGGFPARPWVTFYVHTDDVAGSLARAQKLGGRVIVPARQLPDGPEIGLFEDPDGQLVGLVRSMA